MIRVLARPLSTLLTFCVVFQCDGVFALAHARRTTRDLRAHVDGTSYLFRHQSVVVALARFSGTASNGPIGAAFQSRLSLYWDFDGRMVAATTPTESLTFSYDVDGIRWRKTVSGVATHFVVDKNRDFEQVLEERDAAGNIDVLYVYGDDLISQERAATGLRFYHVDGQMSTRQLTDAGANATDTYTFDAFGVTLASTGATPNNHLYVGEQLDPNIGFYYLRARYLNPSAGRFTTEDPFPGFASDPPSLHRYLYAALNPVTNFDPSGELTLLETLGVAAILGILLGLAITGLGPGERRKGETLSDCITRLLQERFGAIFEAIIVTGAIAVSAAAVAAGLVRPIADGVQFFSPEWVQMIGGQIATIPRATQVGAISITFFFAGVQRTIYLAADFTSRVFTGIVQTGRFTPALLLKILLVVVVFVVAVIIGAAIGAWIRCLATKKDP